MTIKSTLLAAMVGVAALSLSGCVEGGGYSGAYVTSYGGPYYGGYGDGFYRDYGPGYHGYRGYRRDDRYGGNRRYDRRDFADRHRDNDRPRGPGRDFRRDGGGGNQIIVPNPDSPRGPMFSRGGT